MNRSTVPNMILRAGLHATSGGWLQGWRRSSRFVRATVRPPYRSFVPPLILWILVGVLFVWAVLAG